MKTATVTTVLSAPQDAVFDYMAEIEHLPEWAIEFTLFQAPGMPDELFDAQHKSVQREFANIERAFNG